MKFLIGSSSARWKPTELFGIWLVFEFCKSGLSGLPFPVLQDEVGTEMVVDIYTEMVVDKYTEMVVDICTEMVVDMYTEMAVDVWNDSKEWNLTRAKRTPWCWRWIYINQGHSENISFNALHV